MPANKIMWSPFLVFLITMWMTGCHSVPKVLPVGVAAPFEGEYRMIGAEVIEGARAAANYWNNEHADSTSLVSIIAYDDLGKPEQARIISRRFAEENGLVAVVGHWLNETTLAASEEYQESGLILISNSPDDVGASYYLSPARETLIESATEYVDGDTGIDSLSTAISLCSQANVSLETLSVDKILICDLELFPFFESYHFGIYFLMGAFPTLTAHAGLNSESPLFEQAYWGTLKAIDVTLVRYNSSQQGTLELQFDAKNRLEASGFNLFVFDGSLSLID